MSNTAKNMHDPFGNDNKDSGFDANHYDVSEQHRQVELLKQSSNNVVKKQSLF